MSGNHERELMSSRATYRRANAHATTRAGVKLSSSSLYERKWQQFRIFCMDARIQEGNGVLDPTDTQQPSAEVIGKIVEFFHYKVVEMGCNPGEVVNIRSALASVYKRKFSRIGEWEVLPDGSTDGSPMNSIMVTEAMQFYRREKKKVGYKRALPFRFKYMAKFWKYAQDKGENSLFSSYLMAANSMRFTLWLRIDELVQLTWSAVGMNEKNEDSVPFHSIYLRERKYMRNEEGQTYDLYEQPEEGCACSFSHLRRWATVYKEMLGRELLPSDPIFPRADEGIRKLEFGEKMIQQTFMESINDIVKVCGIIPTNASGVEMGRFTAHWFRRGGAQHRYVTGKSRWPLDVKWWGGWGTGDDVNTIIRYLLEETSRYERNFTHYLYTRGADSHMFSTNVRTNEDLGRELSALQTSMTSKLAQMEQNAAANRLLVSEGLNKFTATLDTSICAAVLNMENAIATLAGQGVAPGTLDEECAPETLNSRLKRPLDISNETQLGKETAIEEDDMELRRRCTHILRVRGWREVVDYWNEGCPEKNLTVPLKQWPKRARTKNLKPKFHDRKLVACEFATIGEQEFISTYYPHDVPLVKLKSLIKDRNNRNAVENGTAIE